MKNVVLVFENKIFKISFSQVQLTDSERNALKHAREKGERKQLKVNS
jgi:predicted DNA binding protein